MKKAGFSSVFLVIILSSLMMLLTVVITVSLDRAADSIAETVTANAGSSVLTECNKDLHDQFGVLAIKNNPAHLSNLAEYYISESIDGLNRFVHLELNTAIVDTGQSNNIFVNDFKKQIALLGARSIVFKKNKSSGLDSFNGDNLPSRKYYRRYSFDANSVASLLEESMPFGTGAGITAYVMNVFTDEEIEYILFGYGSASMNSALTWENIYLIRCVINCVEEIEAPALWLEAIARSALETDEIMADKNKLEQYLRALVFSMSSNDILAFRIMDLMQMTIGNGFYFEDYTYGFELNAQFTRGKKSGTITQLHKYTQ